MQHGKLGPKPDRKVVMTNYVRVLVCTHCYENGNGVHKMINKNYKSKNNGLFYMINE